jgi:hypothetical protein
MRRTRGAKKIPKTVLIIRLKIKETTYTFVFVKNLVASFPSHLGIFSVYGRFIADYLQILTCWKKSKYANVIISSNLIENC